MFEKIVWATDGSEAADGALPYAKALARCAGDTLYVVHAHELFVSRAGRYPVNADEDEIEAKIRGQVEELRAEGFETMLLEAGAVSGNPAQLIADTARGIDADVVVVGTRGHSPVAGVFLGSVTQRLLHVAPCPVLAAPAVRGAKAVEPEPATAAA